MAPLRLGILGAAAIAPTAVIRPARENPEIAVQSIAARDPGRAARFARRHRIPDVHPSYEELLADADVDAVYVPLPNSLHAKWAIKALRQGKHVLCEKPLAANADEARRMAAVAKETGRVLFEAFHYRYHPLARRMKEIVDGGQLGALTRLTVTLAIPLARPRDIRYRFDLAGGAMMDLGCYALNMIRYLSGQEPQVIGAEAGLASSQVDRWMKADFALANGATARMHVSLWSSTLIRLRLHAQGTRGEMRVINPLVPQMLVHSLSLRFAQGRWHKETFPKSTTYAHQMQAFVGAVVEGLPFPTNPNDAVANMRAIDAVYEASGLRRRGA